MLSATISTFAFLYRYSGLSFLLTLVQSYFATLESKIERVAQFILKHKITALLALAFEYTAFHTIPALKQTGIDSWVLWAVVLVFQNFAFTYVSRARNSGSLMRHMKAGFFSNGVWFASQTIILSKLMEYISGKHGIWFAVGTGLYYTAFTLTGSVLAHYSSMQSEKGKAAVGANKAYAQIPTKDWDDAKALLHNLSTVVHNMIGPALPAPVQPVKVSTEAAKFITAAQMHQVADGATVTFTIEPTAQRSVEVVIPKVGE